MLRSETLNKQEQWVVDGLVGRPARLQLSSFARALNVVEKSIFDSQTEKPRQGECMNEARIELARLAVVDGLPRDVKPLGKLALTPSGLTTQLANLVFQRLRTACATARTAHTAAMTDRTTNRRPSRCRRGVTRSAVHSGAPGLRPRSAGRSAGRMTIRSTFVG